MKKYYACIFLLFFLIMPFRVKAVCDDSRKSELQKIAGNITYGYDYVKETDSFNITITNLNPNIYMDLNNSGVIYTYNSPELTLGGYRPGDSLKLYVYDTEYCVSSSLNILYINLPIKNKYYGLEVCNDIPNYSLCQMWTSTNNNLTEEEFIQKINQYKSRQQEQEKNVEEFETSNYVVEFLIEIYIKYYFIILPIIIILCIFGMYRLNKKRSL